MIDLTGSSTMWCDIGVNLSSDRFDLDRDQVVDNAVKAGVSTLLLTGTSVEESIRVADMAETYAPHAFATAGVHPHDAKSFNQDTLEALRELLKRQRVVAVGETGLDFNRNFSTPAEQEYAFIQQLGLAAETGLPLFLHERDASLRMIELLKAHRDSWQAGVLHCFTGNREALFAYLDLGLYIGITGWVCDERRGIELQELVKLIPADRLLIETDAPWLLPRDMRPKPKSSRNMPAYLPHIGETVAKLRAENSEKLAEQTKVNAQRLFNF